MPKKPSGDTKTLSDKIWKLYNATEKSSDAWWKGEMKKLGQEAKLIENKAVIDMPMGFLLGFLAAIILFIIYLAF